MMKFLGKFFALLMTVALLYGGFFSFFTVKEKSIGVVEDLRSGNVVTLFHKEYNFVWQGAVPWWFSVYRMPTINSFMKNVRVPFPQMELLAGELYSVIIPVHINYQIIPSTFYDYQGLKNNREGLEKRVVEIAQGIYSRILYPYLYPRYRMNEINREWEGIQEQVLDEMTGRFGATGVKILGLKTSGSLILPTQRTYREGLMHAYEMRKIAEKNEVDMALLKSRLKREALEKEDRMKKLKEMSALIKVNPEILKYIYIDKLGSHVRVILSPESSGYPLGIDEVLDSKKEKREVDNLR